MKKNREKVMKKKPHQPRSVPVLCVCGAVFTLGWERETSGGKQGWPFAEVPGKKL